MRRNKFVILFAVIALVLASLACNALSGGGSNDTTTNTTDSNTNTSSDTNDGGGISFSTANITNIHLAKDENDSEKVSSYVPSDQYFYCFFDLNNAPEDTVVKGSWILVSADGYDSNQEIDSAEVTGSDNTYYFSLNRSTDAWPVGQYRIDLYVNGDLVNSVDFEVQ